MTNIPNTITKMSASEKYPNSKFSQKFLSKFKKIKKPIEIFILLTRITKMEKIYPIDPESLRENLNADILNLLVQYLDRHVTTMLNNTYRKNYFRRNLLTPREWYLTDRHMLGKVTKFLAKYPEVMIRISGHIREYHTDEAVRFRVVEISDRYTEMNLSEINRVFPNIREINSAVGADLESIKKHNMVSGSLRFRISSQEDIENYRQVMPPNLIQIKKPTYESDCLNLTGLEHKIYAIPYRYIQKDKSYPNLEIILGDIEDNTITKSDMVFPKLRYLYVYNRDLYSDYLEEFVDKYNVHQVHC